LKSDINVLAICGNTRPNSVNEQILIWSANRYASQLKLNIYNNIADLPHFRSDLTGDNVPASVAKFYRLITLADAVIICTPEYVFSLPGSIKNALDWAVSTTVFSGKPTGLIVASTLGSKAQEALNLIMTTLGATIPTNCDVLISSIKTKINKLGVVTDLNTIDQIDLLVQSLINKVEQM
jgi:chromate reductase